MDIDPVKSVTLHLEWRSAFEIPVGRASQQDTHDADMRNDDRSPADRTQPGFDAFPDQSWRLAARRPKVPSPFLDMAITRTAVLEQVDPAPALPAAPVHFDQRRNGGRLAPGDDARGFHRARERARKQSGVLEFIGQPKPGEMVARLRVQRFVDTTLYAAGAVPRGVAVAQECEARGNQRRRSARRGESSAASVARAAGSRCSLAIRLRPLRPAAILPSISMASMSIALA